MRESGEGNPIGKNTRTTLLRKTKNIMVGQHHSIDTINIRKDFKEYRE